VRSCRDMDALVLTCNRYHPFTDHMIRCYERLWVNHEFTFYVPFQSELASGVTHDLLARPDVVGVPSEVSIKQTVDALIDGREDDEWIYWCLDDKYPIAFQNNVLERTIEWLPELPSSAVGITLCRCRNLRAPWNIRDFSLTSSWGEKFLARNGLSQFWLHSFLRVSFLRTVFDLIPEGLPEAHLMDQYIGQNEDGWNVPDDVQYLVSEHNWMHLGESTSRGVMTQNCAQSFQSLNLEFPANFKVGEKYVLMPGIR